MRHSHATALLMAGTPVHVVSRRLGHADIQTTLRLYAHVTEDAELRAAAGWASLAAGWQAGPPAPGRIGPGRCDMSTSRHDPCPQTNAPAYRGGTLAREKHDSRICSGSDAHNASSARGS